MEDLIATDVLFLVRLAANELWKSFEKKNNLHVPPQFSLSQFASAVAAGALIVLVAAVVQYRKSAHQNS